MPEPNPAPPTTVAIVTLGCGRNEVDSQNAAGMLAAAGYQVVDDPEQADAVVVNTCAFVEAAKRESIETVLDATALKEQGRARTVLVTGCLAERSGPTRRRDGGEGIGVTFRGISGGGLPRG